MKLTRYMLAVLGLGLVTSATAGLKEIGTINGVTIVRIKTLGVFAPSSTTVLCYTKGKTGEVQILNYVGGAGVVPSIAQAGGLVGAAAVLRPPTTKVSQNGSSHAETFSQGGEAIVSGGNGNSNGGGNGGNNGNGGNPHFN